MQQMTRRSFLTAATAALAGAVLDPERLLWVPGRRTYFDFGALPPVDLWPNVIGVNGAKADLMQMAADLVNGAALAIPVWSWRGGEPGGDKSRLFDPPERHARPVRLVDGLPAVGFARMHRVFVGPHHPLSSAVDVARAAAKQPCEVVASPRELAAVVPSYVGTSESAAAYDAKTGIVVRLTRYDEVGRGTVVDVDYVGRCWTPTRDGRA